MPIPLPIKRQFFRCCSFASRNRGNHSKGAETSLPSASTTLSASEEKDKSIILGSTLTAKVFIPLLLTYSLIFLYCFPQFRNLTTAKPFRFCQLNRIQPKFW